MSGAKFLAAACLALMLGGSSASAADMDGQKITLAAPERTVDLTYFRAPGDAKRPAVLLLHGAGGFDGQIAAYRKYCTELANNGIDAYLVYYYSPADELDMRRDGNTFGRRYPAWAKLVDDLADKIKAGPDSSGKVGLIGFSNGALLASGAGARDAKIDAAVIYWRAGRAWITIGAGDAFSAAADFAWRRRPDHSGAGRQGAGGFCRAAWRKGGAGDLSGGEPWLWFAAFDQ